MNLLFHKSNKIDIVSKTYLLQGTSFITAVDIVDKKCNRCNLCCEVQ